MNFYTNDCFQERRRKLMKTAPVLQARLLHKKRVSLFFAKKSETFYSMEPKTISDRIIILIHYFSRNLYYVPFYKATYFQVSKYFFHGPISFPGFLEAS